METVSVKFQENVLKKVDTSIIKHNFNSRTEFIREAIRDKLVKLERNILVEEFLKFRGRSKKKTTYADNKKTKANVSKELIAELDKRFS
jgi:Arc/MetJ-type ribon-helix-helix transcriptional regulator